MGEEPRRASTLASICTSSGSRVVGIQKLNDDEEFARKRRLPGRWLELREASNQLVVQPDFWYRPDLRRKAQQLAVSASEILQRSLKQENVPSDGEFHMP